MILFRNIRWKNLLSTGNYYTEISLSGNTNTLIVGENGSGKSTMLDALCFALFGKPFRNINKPQLLNSINGKDCVVEVEFDTGNKSYKIIRGIKPNTFEIYCNGELLNQDAAAKDYQEHLEKFILKLNYKSFTQIVILGSASFTPFMQLKSTDRREIIEDLLEIQIFSTMNSLVKERISGNKDVTTQLKYDIELTSQKYEMQKKYIDDQKQNDGNKAKEYDTEIKNHNDTIKKLLSKVSSINIEVEKLQIAVSSKLETESKVGKITKLESQIENTLSKHRKDIAFFETHNTCPTCKQDIAAEVKQSEIGNLQNKVVECQHGMSELEKRLLVEQSKLNDINNKQTEINNKQVSIATINTTISETNKMIARLQKLVDELNSKGVTTKQEEESLNTLKMSLYTMQSNLKDVMQEKKYFEVASNLLKDSGIKTKIVKQYLPVINKLINKYLATLDFFVNFNLDESFRETIKSRYRDEFSYHNFSEGEKQRIDMALMLTWRAVAKLRNSANTNLLILDETFDSSLDTNGTEELMKILHELEGVNLFVISHKGDILQDKFMNTIRFVKEKNFSKVMK
jgi:DNA repair exonuclease SbcCD ATPase subunit